MLIEIFEVKGSSEISTDLDVLILDLYKKSHGEIELKKIDVLDKNQIKPYKDVIEIIKVRGLEALPVVVE